MKQRVSWLLFCSCGARIQEWAHIPTFGRHNAKKGTFCTFGAKSAKNSSFSFFGARRAKAVAETFCLIKLSSQGAQWTKRCGFGLQNAFWNPRSLGATSGLSGRAKKDSRIASATRFDKETREKCTGSRSSKAFAASSSIASAATQARHRLF